MLLALGVEDDKIHLSLSFLLASCFLSFFFYVYLVVPFTSSFLSVYRASLSLISIPCLPASTVTVTRQNRSLRCSHHSYSRFSSISPLPPSSLSSLPIFTLFLCLLSFLIPPILFYVSAPSFSINPYLSLHSYHHVSPRPLQPRPLYQLSLYPPFLHSSIVNGFLIHPQFILIFHPLSNTSALLLPQFFYPNY